MISFLVDGQCACLGRFRLRGSRRVADQRDYIINPPRDRDHHHDVRLCVLLDRTSIYRVVTSFLLFFRDARISEAEDSLGVKKEVACIGLRRVQARQCRFNPFSSAGL